MRRRTAIVRILAVGCLMLLSAGCLARSDRQASDERGKVGSGVKFGEEKGQADSPGQAQAPITSLPPGTGNDGVVGGGGGGLQPGTQPERIDDDAGLGANSHFYLNAKVGKLVIEIDAVDGMSPTRAAVDLLVTRLRSVADKPDGIEVLPVETIDESRDSWSVNDLLDAEARHRDVLSTKAAIVLYILYVDGEFAGNANAIGVAYKASTFAVFKEGIGDAAFGLVSAVDIEKAVLVHEAGHVLALVNITYTSPRNHEDPGNKGHSNNSQSVMYWAVDTVDVVRLLGGETAPPTDFDRDDRADLADLKSGKLP